MGDVVTLIPRERMTKDVERLLEANGGPIPDGEFVPPEMDLAMEELAETLGRVARAYRTGQIGRAAEAARDGAEQARALGLNRAFRVARAVETLASQGDGPALAANVARLMRLGDAALTSIWRVRDAPM